MGLISYFAIQGKLTMMGLIQAALRTKHFHQGEAQEIPNTGIVGIVTVQMALHSIIIIQPADIVTIMAMAVKEI